MDEMIVTGYCRCLDGSRTVLVEEGEPDCLFVDCPHNKDCPIAEKIREALKG